MAEQSRHGYLVLAGISGYTSFLAKVELEHAYEILTDLLEVIVDKFMSMLTISKLVGDAVFAYVGESVVPRGETLKERSKPPSSTGNFSTTSYNMVLIKPKGYDYYEIKPLPDRNGSVFISRWKADTSTSL